MIHFDFQTLCFIGIAVELITANKFESNINCGNVRNETNANFMYIANCIDYLSILLQHINVNI